MKTIKVSKAIDLSQQMVDRYKDLILNIEVQFKCPICIFMNDKTPSGTIYCRNCFNRAIPDKHISKGCVAMKTFPSNKQNINYRLLYWKEVVKYLNTFNSKYIKITILRNKCNQIDNKLI